MPYLVMTAEAGQPSDRFAHLLNDLQDRGWRLTLSAFGLAVLTKGGCPPEITPIRTLFKIEGVLIGRCFDRQPNSAGRAVRASLDGLAELDPLEAARALIKGTFGAYVAVLAPDRAAPAVLRSPTGMIDAFTWRCGPVVFAGDDIPEGAAAPEGLGIDWSGVGAVLAHSIRAVARTPRSDDAGSAPGAVGGPAAQI